MTAASMRTSNTVVVVLAELTTPGKCITVNKAGEGGCGHR
jgi:hypothetical protein